MYYINTCIVIKHIIVNIKVLWLFVHLIKASNLKISSCVNAVIITICTPRKIKDTTNGKEILVQEHCLTKHLSMLFQVCLS